MDEVIEFVTQYIMTLVSNSSFVKSDSRHNDESFKLHPFPMKNFSTMYAANPAGESFSPMPTESGLVAVKRNVPCSLDWQAKRF